MESRNKHTCKFLKQNEQNNACHCERKEMLLCLRRRALSRVRQQRDPAGNALAASWDTVSGGSAPRRRHAEEEPGEGNPEGARNVARTCGPLAEEWNRGT